MTRQDDLRDLIANHSRRLHNLRRQQALQGVAVDPLVLVEIEDIQARIEELQAELEKDAETSQLVDAISDHTTDQALKTREEETLKELILRYKRRLYKLREQRAMFGFSTDPAIVLEIEDLEAELSRLEMELKELQAGSSQVIVSPTHDFEISKSTKVVKLKNPYTFGVPVRGEDNFFGREQELQLIFNTLESVPRGQKQDLVLMGPRRIGKSSILLRLLDTYPDDFVPLYIDLQAIKPREPYILFVTILQKISKAFKNHNLGSYLPDFEILTTTSIPEKLQYLTFGEDIEQVNQIISRRQLPRLMLMFDEIELLTEIGGVSALEWFRSLIQSLNYCIFIVAGSDLLYELTTDYTSPFYNIFKIVEVRALSEQAATELITVPAAKVGVTYPKTEIKRILRYTGRNPYFIQAMGHYLVEWLNKKGRDNILPADIDLVADQMIDNLSAQFNYFWSSFSAREQAILYLMARQPTSQTSTALVNEFLSFTNIRLSKQDQREMFAKLSRQQAIQPLTTDHNPKYEFVVQLFASWISSKIKREEILDRIRRQELVEQVTTDSSQLDSLRSTLALYVRNLRMLEEQRAVYGVGSPIHLLNQIEVTKESISELEEQIRRLDREASTP